MMTAANTPEKVAVLMGGWSSEREVSLDSGREVAAGLRAAGHDVVEIDVQPETLLSLDSADFDVAFVIMHGPGGEDGTAQAVLDLQRIAYTGSGMAASALAMDKLKTKQVWQSAGIPTPAFRIVDETTDSGTLVADLGLPMFIKPVTEGSSIGLSRVTDEAEVAPAIAAASAHDTGVIAEAGISGGEYTAAILGRDVLPLLKIETENAFYDFHAKYESDDTRYLCPCGLDSEKEAALGALALKAFDAIGASGWGRVDFMLDDEGAPWFLELNTVPGMTSHSLVPMAARAAGIEFPQLVDRIVRMAQVSETRR